MKLNLKLSLVILTFITNTSGWCESVKQGQETWGGDAAALKFVKFGRLLHYELLNNKSCKIDPVTAEQWRKLVDETYVESTEQDRRSESGRVYFNIYKWNGLEHVWKAELVLQLYLEQLSQSPTPEFIKQTIKHCRTSSLWSRNSNQKGEEDNGKLKEDIIKNANELAVLIENKTIKNLPEGFSFEKFKKTIRGLLVSELPEVKQKVTLRSNSISMLTDKNTLKDGQNTVTGNGSELQINMATWRQLSAGQKKELLFHELLGLMRLDDHRYQFSSLLLFDLDRDEYAKH